MKHDESGEKWSHQKQMPAGQSLGRMSCLLLSVVTVRLCCLSCCPFLLGRNQKLESLALNGRPNFNMSLGQVCGRRLTAALLASQS